MKKNILLATIPLLMICFLTSVLGTPQLSSNISTYGAVQYSSFKMGVYTASWNFAEYDAQTIANTINMSQSAYVYDPANDYAAKMNQVHALNPAYKALVYRNVGCVHSYRTEEWDYCYEQGWLLKDANGNYVVNQKWPEDYLVDITNSKYQTWLANLMVSWLQQKPYFDGVMADNSLKRGERDWYGGATERPINPRTGTYFTDDEILTGLGNLLNKLQTAIGPKVLLSNGIWSGNAFYSHPNTYTKSLSIASNITGLFSESLFIASYFPNVLWLYESEWRQSLDLVVWVRDNFMAGHPERYFVGWCPATSTNNAELAQPGAREQVTMFGYCSVLLGAGTVGTYVTGFGIGLEDYPNLMVLAEKLQSIDMIKPLNDYYKIPSTSIYARDFTKGKVLVNPTDVSYTVTLDGSYTTFDNNIVSGSLTISGHTGVILFK